MKIREGLHQGLAFWYVDTWFNEGIFHGFLGADLDVALGSAQWDAVFGQDSAETKRRLLLLNQVHGTEFCRVDAEGYWLGGQLLSQYDTPCNKSVSADAWLVDLSRPDSCEFCFGIRTADCFPVLICSRRPGSIIAALHCGWRGAIGGLLPLLIGEIERRGASPGELEMALGPGAQICCYQVSAELGRQFAEARQALLGFSSDEDEKKYLGLPRIVESRGGRMFCDISQLLVQQAKSCGIGEENIVLTGECTICNHRFFSYRRQKASSGRQLSFISGRGVGR